MSGCHSIRLHGALCRWFLVSFCILFVAGNTSGQVYQRFVDFSQAQAAEEETNIGLPSQIVTGADGNFYGISPTGGAYGDGTFFRLTPAGAINVQGNFNGQTGSSPTALVLGSDGNFYGITTNGGANGDGTIFETTPGGSITTLFSFGASTDIHPTCFVQGIDGYFYGAGANTIFKFNQFTSTFSTVASMAGVDCLIQGANGNLYGTTPTGGQYFGTTDEIVSFTNGGGGTGNLGNVDPFKTGYGTVFEIGPDGSTVFSQSFSGGQGPTPGAAPTGLVQGADGNVYGVTTGSGGTDGTDNAVGTFLPVSGQLVIDYSTTTYTETVPQQIFGVTPSGAISYVSSSGINGSPIQLVQAPDQSFYVSTASGIFQFNVGSANAAVSIATVQNANDLILGTDGSLYGTGIISGGSGGNSIVRVTTGGTVQSLFDIPSTSPVVGSNPGPFVQGGDGYLHGIASDGSTFAVDLTGNISRGIDLQNYAQGLSPFNFVYAIFTDQSGNVDYAITDGVYENSFNNEFQSTASEAHLITSEGIANFPAQFLGLEPQGEETLVPPLPCQFVQLTNGTFFGYFGTEFSALESSNSGIPLYFQPGVTGMLAGSDGNAYYYVNGVLSNYDPITNTYDTTDPVTLPSHELIEGPNSTSAYGSDGNLYQISGNTIIGGGVTVHDFTNDPDGSPQALIAASDGNLYGTVSGGSDAGAIFRIVVPGSPQITIGSVTAQTATSESFSLTGNARGSLSTFTLQYGLSSSDPFPDSAPITATLDGSSTTLLGTTLTGLTPGATYYYQIVATNSLGTTMSSVQSFRTLAPPTAVATPAANVLPTSAQMKGTVNAVSDSTTVVFQYSTDINFSPGLTTTTQPMTVTGATDTSVSAPADPLSPGTTYYYRISASSIGGTTVSGTSSFTTLTNPVAVATAATAIGSQSAQLNGTVNAMGDPLGAAVTFEYGTVTNGIFTSIGSQVIANPVMGNMPVTVSVNISSSTTAPLVQGTTYDYEIVATGNSSALTGTSALVPFSLQILSATNRVFPSAPLPYQGSIQISLTPAASGNYSPGWRLAGERLWRASGTTVQGLATGDYQVEYQPQINYGSGQQYIQPPPETLSATSGTPTVVSRQYYPTPGGGPTGSLQVTLAPANLPGTHWHFLGETIWRNSGDSVSLSPGNYLVECEPVTIGQITQITPPLSSITVASGVAASITLTYLTPNPASGASPAPLTFSTITDRTTGSTTQGQSQPYAFVGQIRSNLGTSTGFVVSRRVVATAAHVVFDDGALAMGQIGPATDLQWLFERQAGTYEPVPLVPRGALVLSGYSSQRIADGTPGVSSPASQNLDVAALYFFADAGGGGYSGYLASDAVTNEFLTSPNLKMLVGYPVDGEPTANQGQMFATAAVNANFTQVLAGNGNPYQVYTTTDLTSVGGNSGGPLCVQFDAGQGQGLQYYPAGIYLGGNGQADVRAIDSDVIGLFTQAETNGETGADNTGGGITQVNTTLSGDTLSSPASLQVNFTTAGAGGAQWTLEPLNSSPAPTLFPGGQPLDNLNAGAYYVYFTPVAGYLTPPSITVTLTGGQLTTLLVPYADLLGGYPTATSNLNDSPWFGYYGAAAYPMIYHYNLGYEYVYNAGGGAVYLYDYKSGHFWFTSPTSYPFIYDFTLHAWLYYYTNNANGGTRYFTNESTHMVISE